MGGAANYRHSDDAPVGEWGMKYGHSAPRVTLFEREDRGKKNQPALYARWYVRGKRNGPYRVQRVATIRDENGAIDMDRRQDAEREAKRIWQAVQDGTPPSEIFSEQEDDEDEEEAGPLTLRRGFDRALDPEEGIYQASSDDDPHFRNRKRHARYACDILGEDRRFDELVPAVVQSVWTRMAEANARRGSFGYRVAEQTVGFLYRTQKWLVNNGYLSSEEAANRMEGWRQQLEKDWERVTEEDPSPDRPAYGEGEMELLMHAVEGRDEDGSWAYDLDPRFRLLMMLGAGQRTGMVAGAPRKWLHLDDSGAHDAGRLKVPSRGKKTGVTIDLTQRARKYIEAQMSDGYLRRLEAAYQEDELSSYRLFPAGRLREGAARRDNAHQAVGKSWRQDQLKALEREIYRRHSDLSLWNEEQRENETMHIHGRGFHGLRRRVARMSRHQGQDREARNAAWGWTRGSTVADELYDETDAELRRAGAEARQEVLEAVSTVRVGGETPSTDAGGEEDRLGKLLDDLSEAIEDGDLERAAALKSRINELRGGE